MDLIDVVHRADPPLPSGEAENIPWGDPSFSQRMLKEHLSQDHDWASRRFDKIETHVAWIQRILLKSVPKRILDLASGPGFYTKRLSLFGHRCVGIDCSPASIMYAMDQANKHDVDCTYLHGDIRNTPYGSDFDLVMLIYGEINSFKGSDAHTILRKAHEALAFGGTLLLEPHSYDGAKRLGTQPPTWFSVEHGIFSDDPYLCLEESFWSGESSTATLRYFIVHTTSASVTLYAQTLQVYSDHEYRAMLHEQGFGDIRIYPSLTGKPDPGQEGFFAISARKVAD